MSAKQKTPDVPKHHWLIQGQVMFVANPGTDDEVIQGVSCNGILIQDGKNIIRHSLGKAQQLLQHYFVKSMGDGMAHVRIIDVVLGSFSYLGHMTEKEFMAVPPGVQLKASDFAAPVAAAPKKPDLKVVPKNDPSPESTQVADGPVPTATDVAKPDIAEAGNGSNPSTGGNAASAAAGGSESAGSADGQQ